MNELIFLFNLIKYDFLIIVATFLQHLLTLKFSTWHVETFKTLP